MRHGKAEDFSAAFNDFERALVMRGRQEAMEAAVAMKAAGIEPEIIVSSPATRTAGTAQIVAQEFGYPHEHVLYHAPLYMGQAGDYLDIANTLKAGCILIVGHNPETGQLAQHYSSEFMNGFPTSSIIALRFEDAAISPQSKAEVVWKWMRE